METSESSDVASIARSLTQSIGSDHSEAMNVPLIVLVDDADFSSRNINNFLWTTFTRSNPASDIDGVSSYTDHKHWGCHGSLVIDARIKKHHAPPLIEDPVVTAKIDAMAARGGPLAKSL